MSAKHICRFKPSMFRAALPILGFGGLLGASLPAVAGGIMIYRRATKVRGWPMPVPRCWPPTPAC